MCVCVSLFLFWYIQSDEYTVYNQHQQRIKYLVEFTLEGDEEPEDTDKEDKDKEALLETSEETSTPDKGKGLTIMFCSGLI